MLRDALREPSTLRFSILRDSLGRTTSPEWNLDVAQVQDPSATRTRGGRQVWAPERYGANVVRATAGTGELHTPATYDEAL